VLDLIVAMDLSASQSTSDIEQVRAWAQDLVDLLAPDPEGPRTTRIGLVQFQGQICPGNRGEGPCFPAARVLAHLTADSQLLTQIISGPPSGCPDLPAQPQGFAPSLSMTEYACPFKAAGGSGSYVRSGLAIVHPPAGESLFAPQNGGRIGAQKVLVLLSDNANNAGISEEVANAETVRYAAIVKRGADGRPDVPRRVQDDVEIFAIGFFGGGESAMLASRVSQCPAAELPLARSPIDEMMIAVSSSRPGTCDHYYPVAKDSNLVPIARALVSVIAGEVVAQ
jgi:hypothetical protein